MNILFLSESYYPHQSGVPVVVKYLAEGLVRKGHRVTVATSIGAAEDLPESDSLNGVGIRRFHIWRNLAKCLRGEIKALQQYVLNGDFDVVVIECGQAATTDALLPVLENVKARKILHAHGLSGMLGRNKPFSIKSDFKHTIGATYNWARMHWYYDVTFKRACHHFDASISLTDSDSGYPYLSRHVKKNYVLGNAADDMFFDETTSISDVVEGEQFLISIANYTVVKDQLNMLRQFYLTSSKHVALVMIGSKENDYYKKVEEEKKHLDEKYGKRQVLMLTGVDRKHFPAILEKASLYLTSSTYEEYSISIIEAMSRGVPFISTDVGNARLLPGGVTIGSISDMHTAIDRLLSDENERKRLSVAAKKYAYEHCRIDAVVTQLEKILEEEVV